MGGANKHAERPCRRAPSAAPTGRHGRLFPSRSVRGARLAVMFMSGAQVNVVAFACKDRTSVS